MAKGVGWAMAEVLGSISVAHLRGVVMVCPICGGPMLGGMMTEQFKCRSSSEDDMPEWLAQALRGQGFNPGAYYHYEGGVKVLATTADGVELGPMRDRGSFGGWQWWGVPEGEITFPDWFPTAARDDYVAARWENWQQQLEELQTHPDAVSIVLSEFAVSHPVLAIEELRSTIAARAKKRQEAAAAEVERQQEQKWFEESLLNKGFFSGRMGKAVLPEGCRVLQAKSHGWRDNPIVLVVGSRLTTEQLVALVEAKGDYSEVVMDGRFPIIVSPDPAFWIGRGGCIAKHLASALGLRFLKVQQK